jgi:Tol biopolymer transport system component
MPVTAGWPFNKTRGLVMRKSLTVLGLVLSIMAQTMVAMALPVFAGGANHVERQSTSASGRSTSDNGQIVFRRYFNAAQTKGALFVMNPDGIHARQITHPPNGWRDNVPAWSPDGKRITFERFKRDESTSRVMFINPDTGDTRTVVPCTGERCVYAIDPYFSPDGHSIAYARTVAPPNAVHPPEWKLYSAIFIVGLDGSNARQVSSTPPRRRGLLALETSDPTFSPDGKLLAFIRTRHSPEENSAVFVQPLGSPEDAHRITPWKMNCQDRPTFSPHGKLMLFRCMPRGEEGPSNLYFAFPDGTGLHRLTPPSADKQYLGSGFSPRFNRGRGWITAGRTGGFGKEGNADVFRILIRDGNVVRKVNLTKSEEWDSGPGWGIHPPVG